MSSSPFPSHGQSPAMPNDPPPPLDGPLLEQLDDDLVEVDGLRVVASALPAGDVAVISHLGGFEGLGVRTPDDAA